MSTYDNASSEALRAEAVTLCLVALASGVVIHLCPQTAPAIRAAWEEAARVAQARARLNEILPKLPPARITFDA